MEIPSHPLAQLSPLLKSYITTLVFLPHIILSTREEVFPHLYPISLQSVGVSGGFYCTWRSDSLVQDFDYLREEFQIQQRQSPSHQIEGTIIAIPKTRQRVTKYLKR